MEVDHEPEVPLEPTKYDTSLAPDGDVILSLPGLDNTQGRALFRVDKVILSRHSTVFAGLFTLPYHPSTNEEHDGVPVVRLEDDQKAMVQLLRFLYHTSPIRWNSLDHKCPSSILGLLNVARKYEINPIRESIASDLGKEWPTTLTGWVLQRGKVVEFEALYNTSAIVAEEVYLDDLMPEPAVAVRIGVDYHIADILPAAFYCLAWIEPTDDWDRYHRCEWSFGEQSGHNGYLENPIWNMRRAARWSLLDKDTLYRVLLGKAELRKRQEAFCFKYALSRTKPGCESPKVCRNMLGRIVRGYNQRVEKKHCPGPLETLSDLCEDIYTTKGLCLECSCGLRTEIDKEVVTIWKDLPSIFSLDSIPGLEKHQWTS